MGKEKDTIIVQWQKPRQKYWKEAKTYIKAILSGRIILICLLLVLGLHWLLNYYIPMDDIEPGYWDDLLQHMLFSIALITVTYAALPLITFPFSSRRIIVSKKKLITNDNRYPWKRFDGYIMDTDKEGKEITCLYFKKSKRTYVKLILPEDEEKKQALLNFLNNTLEYWDNRPQWDHPSQRPSFSSKEATFVLLLAIGTGILTAYAVGNLTRDNFIRITILLLVLGPSTCYMLVAKWKWLKKYPDILSVAITYNLITCAIFMTIKTIQKVAGEISPP